MPISGELVAGALASLAFVGCSLSNASGASGPAAPNPRAGQRRRREGVVDGKRAKTLDLRGLSVGGSVAGQELADPKFHPVWAKAEELGILIFMHPLGTRELEPSGRLNGSGLLTNTIGNPLETTIALSHLIFEGTLDRFPGLKICAAHGGGYLPSYAARSDAVITTFPNRVGPLPKKKPTQYLKDGQLYFDSIMFTPEGLRHLIAETGPDKVVIGTDYPFPWNRVPVDHILSTPGLSDDDKIAILGGTAAKLLGIAA